MFGTPCVRLALRCLESSNGARAPATSMVETSDAGLSCTALNTSATMSDCCHYGEFGCDEPFTDSQAGAVELRVIIDEVIETFNEKHRQVIELHVFDGLPAVQVCERIADMSEDNVAQIASRFRARLRQRLDERSDG